MQPSSGLHRVQFAMALFVCDLHADYLYFVVCNGSIYSSPVLRSCVASYSSVLNIVFACSCRLLATLIIQPASPFGADVVCQNHPKLPMTPHQVEMCKTRSRLMTVLFKDAVEVFKHQLLRHFKNERWDGREINPPIFGSTDEILTLSELLNYFSV